MSEPRIDAELLAAFLDGTATPSEREQVLRLIAGSAEAYAEFSETVAIRGQLQAGVSEGNDGGGVDGAHVREHPATPAPAPASAQPARRFPLIASLVLLAAALAAVVLFPRDTPKSGSGDVYAAAQTLRVPGATGSGALARTLGANWDAPGWSVTRGDADVGAAEHMLAFRTGLRAAQLRAATMVADSQAVAAARDEILLLLRPVNGSGPLVSQLGTWQPAATVTDAETLTTALRAIVGQDAWFDLGFWTGTARIAALGGQAPFFAADGAAIAALRELTARPLSPEEPWARIRAIVAPLVDSPRERAGGMPAALEILTQLAVVAGG